MQKDSHNYPDGSGKKADGHFFVTSLRPSATFLKFRWKKTLWLVIDEGVCSSIMLQCLSKKIMLQPPYKWFGNPDGGRLAR